jgi:hypothetical protein
VSDDLFARPAASHYGLTTFRLTNFAQPWQFQSLRKMILRTPQIRFRSVWSDVLVLLANRTKVVLRFFLHVEGHHGVAFLALENNVDRFPPGHHGHAPNRNYFPIAFGG